MKTMTLALVAATVLVASAASAADPNPYAGYKAAMTSPTNNPFAAVWQQANRAQLDAAVAEERLAAFVATDEAARALLTKIRPDWQTDVVVAEQIAAVTQWVMRPEPPWYALFTPSPCAERCRWTRALVATALASKEPSVRMFCLDQLRWCGYGCPAFIGKVRAIGTDSTRAVRDFAEWVIRELESKGIGRH